VYTFSLIVVKIIVIIIRTTTTTTTKKFDLCYNNNSNKVIIKILTGQISKSGTRTPPRGYKVWWSQEKLIVYRLDDKTGN